jgi:thiamine biosynthesis lipoprotein ApbE
MSVASNTSVTAGALSTGVFVTGVERGRDLISRHKASGFIAIVEQGGRELIVSTI